MTLKMQTKESFILVMPSFNEEKRIGNTLNSWAKVIGKIPGSEILIVDGNSNDKTREVVNSFQKKFKFIKLIHKPREGYGKDLLHGYNIAVNSKHDWVFQTDADGHYNSSDFFKFWQKRNSSPFIIGSRIKRQDTKFRLLISSFIEFWIIILFNIKIKDSNIPFRLIRKDYLENILYKVPQTTIAPNIFLTIIAKKDGYKLHNIPVKHKARPSHNNIRLFKGAIRGFLELTLFSILYSQSFYSEGEK